MKGLGQALIYRQGANLAYLAAPADRLDGYVQPALASGVGVLKVGQAGVEEVQKPPSSVAMRFLPDVQRELALLAARGDQTRRIGSPRLTLNHPLHYLAPVLFIDEAASVEEVLDVLGCSDGWALGASVVRVAVEGAKVLGLVAEDGGMLRLTEKGRLVRRMVVAATPGMTPPELRGLVSRQPLIDVNPLLGVWFIGPSRNGLVGAMRLFEPHKKGMVGNAAPESPRFESGIGPFTGQEPSKGAQGLQAPSGAI